ncbi:MAG TPA: hypothetical protein VHT68_15725 [Pseudolabrys sp.]|jgi:hypothetical protein|nr:hypothetical protein [Pseudolabrys sp.]
MIRRADLVNAMATTLGNVPELVAVLAPTDPIVPYIDSNPTMNSVDKWTYQMQPGQILVIWISTRLTKGEMSKWSHAIEILCRSLPDESDMELEDLIVAGVPNPGDGMVWRNCPLMAGVYPTEVVDIGRRTDTEGVDYGVILTETAETGDWPYP